ncbi:signal peptide peptidase SppA [Oculatella sp. LEGE 06141]|uniref:signal peptide peptidase SppA n=1 Tax=Oculatella sp. LEGE 06141 TaxID=1828648 RepID=UPI00187F691C|nr:signal peptide peptidase SppA [Oculatella sp. LEGE 06141]MBE9178238.1 signal peptide peptidase SppA [Oculatella sp. LEGE 06141]
MRDFLKHTFATLAGLVIFVTLGFAGLAVLLTAIASLGRDASPQVDADSILTFDLALNITDAPPSPDPSRLLSDALSGTEIPTSIGLQEVVRAVKDAATDDRIVGLYLHGDTSSVAGGSGFAALREVRDALEAFQQSGKPILAYTTTGSERDYYLVSVADTIALNPAGVMELDGFSAETTFFAGALQKYGVGIQTIRAGQYKAAVEPFTRTESSPQSKTQTQQLLADLWNEFRVTTSNSRDVTSEQIQTIADRQGLLLPAQAQSAGLIDQVAYEDEIFSELRKLTGETEDDLDADDLESFRQISLPTYAATIEQAADVEVGSNQIAVLYAEGDIVSGMGGDGSIGSDRYTSQIRELRLNDDIKAVVLRINSPGGSATASDAIAREVMLTSQVKPVIVSMGSYAASGGYLISAYADQIFASPTTITGSIGVFGLLPNVQQIANDNGITWDVVQTGQFANSNTITRPKTAAELANTQRVVDHFYDQFLTVVANSRSISKQQVGEIAQGRVWSGLAAQRVGLVDELGGLDAAIQAAAAQADLGEDWHIEEYPQGRTLEFRLLRRLFSSRLVQTNQPIDPLSLELKKLRSDLETLRSLNDPLGTYTRLPFTAWID